MTTPTRDGGPATWPAWADPLRWIIRVPLIHRVVHRLFPRPYVHDGMPLTSCPVCAYVWRRLEAEPAFSEAMREVEAELEAGGGVRYEVVDGRLERVPDPAAATPALSTEETL